MFLKYSKLYQQVFMELEEKVIVFNEMELNSLKEMAHWRSDHKVKGNYKTQNIYMTTGKNDFQNSFLGHYLGVVGEYGVASVTNGFFDPLPKMKGDKHAPDVIVGFAGEAKIAVKTTKYAPPIFKFKNLEQLGDCTHFAMCCFQEPKLTIAWIRRKEDFLQRIYERDFGRGRTYCVD